MIVTETERLIIRRLRPDDRDALMAVFGDPEVMRFGDGVQSATWVTNWISAGLNSYEQRGYGPWSLLSKTEDRVIGYCGLFYFPEIDGRPEIEIGYRLARSDWKQGFATEAVNAVRDYAFGTLLLPRLVCLIDPGNIASIRVAAKCGLRYEKDVMLPGYTYPDRLYVVGRT